MAKHKSVQQTLSAGRLNLVLVRLLAAMKTMVCPACGSPHFVLTVIADAAMQTADLTFGCKQCLDSGTLSSSSEEQPLTQGNPGMGQPQKPDGAVPPFPDNVFDQRP